MTEPIAATPGWVDARLDEVFAALPDTGPVATAKQEYAQCLAARKAPAAPSDLLGAEFAPCRPALTRALRAAGVIDAKLAALETGLEALEAEIASGS